MSMLGSLKVCKNRCQIMTMIPTASWVTHVRPLNFMSHKLMVSVLPMTSWTKQSPEIFKSRNFCGVFETICWIPQGAFRTLNGNIVAYSHLDPNARPSCCGWNSLIIFATPERHNLHWKAAVTYASDVFIVHFNTNSDVTRFCAERLQSLIRTLSSIVLTNMRASRKLPVSRP